MHSTKVVFSGSVRRFFAVLPVLAVALFAAPDVTAQAPKAAPSAAPVAPKVDPPKPATSAAPKADDK